MEPNGISPEEASSSEKFSDGMESVSREQRKSRLEISASPLAVPQVREGWFEGPRGPEAPCPGLDRLNSTPYNLSKRSLAKMARRGHGDRRKDILRAAGQLFSRRGYHGTSIRDIAAAIRLQGGSLYAHISSKEELLWEIVDEAAQAFLSSVEPIVRSERPPMEKLRLAVAAHLQVVTERQDAAVVFNHEWKALSPRRRADILARRDAYEALFREILREGIEAGVFRADLDVPLITRFILTALNGVAVWYRPMGPLSPEQIAEAFTDWAIRGLQIGKPTEAT